MDENTIPSMNALPEDFDSIGPAFLRLGHFTASEKTALKAAMMVAQQRSSNNNSSQCMEELIAFEFPKSIPGLLRYKGLK